MHNTRDTRTTPVLEYNSTDEKINRN